MNAQMSEVLEDKEMEGPIGGRDRIEFPVPMRFFFHPFSTFFSSISFFSVNIDEWIVVYSNMAGKGGM